MLDAHRQPQSRNHATSRCASSVIYIVTFASLCDDEALVDNASEGVPCISAIQDCQLNAISPSDCPETTQGPQHRITFLGATNLRIPP